MDIFGDESSVELVKSLVRESNQSNHVSLPETPLPRTKTSRLKETSYLAGNENGGACCEFMAMGSPSRPCFGQYHYVLFSREMIR